MQNIKKNEFLTIVLTLLESMGEIESKFIDNQNIGLYKSEALVGLIIENNLYLRTNINNRIFDIFKEDILFQGQEYSKVNKELFIKEEDKDMILQAATYAYWLASGKVRS